MNESIQSHRAHVINLCCAVEEACSLTDITVLKTQARMILVEMGVCEAAPEPKVEGEDSLW